MSTMARQAHWSTASREPMAWPNVPLHELCEKHTGVRDPRLTPDTAFRYVDITSIERLTKTIVDARAIPGRDAPSRARKAIRANDVVISTTRPNLNAVALISSDLDGQIASTGFCILRANERLDPDFLFAYVRSPVFVASLSDLVVGALYPAVTDRQVMGQTIPLPPLPEQKRIAALLRNQLGAAARMRAAAELQVDDAEQLLATELRRLFDRGATGGWPIMHVRDICERLDYGYTASADASLSAPKFLRITDIQKGIVDWRDVPGCRIDEASEAAKRLCDGDLVFARTGATTGKSFLILDPPRAVFASYLIRMRFRTDVEPAFVYAFFRSDSYWQQVRHAARGGAQPNVNASLLGNVRLPLPSVREQLHAADRIAKVSAAVDRIRHASTTEVAAADCVFASLLRRAFSGGL